MAKSSGFINGKVVRFHVDSSRAVRFAGRRFDSPARRVLPENLPGGRVYGLLPLWPSGPTHR